MRGRDPMSPAHTARQGRACTKVTLQAIWHGALQHSPQDSCHRQAIAQPIVWREGAPAYQPHWWWHPCASPMLSMNYANFMAPRAGARAHPCRHEVRIEPQTHSRNARETSPTRLAGRKPSGQAGLRERLVVHTMERRTELPLEICTARRHGCPKLWAPPCHDYPAVEARPQ